MSTVIPQRDLRNHNARIIDRVAAGESFVVTRDGVPVADVSPHVDGRRPPMFPKAAVLIDFFAPTSLDARMWEADIRSADDVLRDDPVDPWLRRG